MIIIDPDLDRELRLGTTVLVLLVAYVITLSTQAKLTDYHTCTHKATVCNIIPVYAQDLECWFMWEQYVVCNEKDSSLRNAFPSRLPLHPMLRGFMGPLIETAFQLLSLRRRKMFKKGEVLFLFIGFGDLSLVYNFNFLE
jgi:hypothetical protein